MKKETFSQDPCSSADQWHRSQYWIPHYKMHLSTLFYFINLQARGRDGELPVKVPPGTQLYDISCGSLAVSCAEWLKFCPRSEGK